MAASPERNRAGKPDRGALPMTHVTTCNGAFKLESSHERFPNVRHRSGHAGCYRAKRLLQSGAGAVHCGRRVVLRMVSAAVSHSLPGIRIESLSGGNPGEKSEGLHSDHRGIPQARSSEGGNVGELPGVSIQSREPVDSNSVSVGRLSPEPRYATDVDAAPSLSMTRRTYDRGVRKVKALR